MSQLLKPGAAVKVCRPGRKMHDWQGRVLEASPTPDFYWIAFGLKGLETAPPDERDLRNKAKHQHLLMPASQLELL